MACFRLRILLILRHASILTRFSLLLDSWAYQNPSELLLLLIPIVSGGLPMFCIFRRQKQGRGDVGRTLSVRMMNGKASCSGLLVDTLMHIPFAPSVYASDDGEAVRVFLSIPSVDVPSAPSICVNNDGEASL
ncbi:hypothetical protein LguiA_033084 [Lonicera macranthoides]